jgi:proteasome lid subunit RPN8/RPN11
MIAIQPLPLEEMKAHAQAVFPNECCGFMYGNELPDNTRMISSIRIVTNSKDGDQRRRFEISGKDYMQAEKYAAMNDLSLLGIFHSHPNHPAIPSEHDRVAAQPFFSYIIISILQAGVDHIRSWRLNDEFQFEEENYSPVQLNQSI